MWSKEAADLSFLSVVRLKPGRKLTREGQVGRRRAGFNEAVIMWSKRGKGYKRND